MSCNPFKFPMTSSQITRLKRDANELATYIIAISLGRGPWAKDGSRLIVLAITYIAVEDTDNRDHVDT